jgi:hypothetical protein
MDIFELSAEDVIALRNKLKLLRTAKSGGASI